MSEDNYSLTVAYDENKILEERKIVRKKDVENVEYLEKFESGIFYRYSCVLYHFLSLFLFLFPILVAVSAATVFLTMYAWWSVVLLVLVWSLLLTTAPALIYAMMRKGWDRSPSFHSRVQEVMRGYKTSFFQSFPLSLFTVMAFMGIGKYAMSEMGATRWALMLLLVLISLYTIRIISIIGLFNFHMKDIVILSGVMTVRDPAGSLFVVTIVCLVIWICSYHMAIPVLLWPIWWALIMWSLKGQYEIVKNEFTDTPNE